MSLTTFALPPGRVRGPHLMNPRAASAAECKGRQQTDGALTLDRWQVRFRAIFEMIKHVIS
jgi:hypothetical protein